MNSELLNRLSNLPLISQILEQLRKELPARLKFHDLSHTLDVLAEVVQFGSYDKLDPRGIELLAIGAAYHDAGYLKRDNNNEALGAEMAILAMKNAGTYSNEEGLLVRQLILDTEIQYGPSGPRQISNSKLSGYLLDADLSNLGRKDFFERNRLLFEELGQIDEIAFLKSSLSLMVTHSWHTLAAKKLRQAQKERNVAKLHLLCDAIS